MYLIIFLSYQLNIIISVSKQHSVCHQWQDNMDLLFMIYQTASFYLESFLICADTI